jgi:hypothetical protein
MQLREGKLVTTYNATQHHSPEDRNRHSTRNSKDLFKSGALLNPQHEVANGFYSETHNIFNQVTSIVLPDLSLSHLGLHLCPFIGL